MYTKRRRLVVKTSRFLKEESRVWTEQEREEPNTLSVGSGTLGTGLMFGSVASRTHATQTTAVNAFVTEGGKRRTENGEEEVV